MTPDVASIADAMVAALVSEGVRARLYVAEGVWQPPEVLIPAPQIRQQTMSVDGLYRMEYRLVLVVASADDRAAHANLAPLMTSCKRALQRDMTLDGTAAGVHVTQVVPDDEIRDRAGNAWFGAYLETSVYT